MRSAFTVAAVIVCLLFACVAMADGVPEPLYMSGKALGGAALNQYTPGVEGGSGPNNIGLLVRTYGKVTFVDAVNKYFYIDDGSGRVDGTMNAGSPVVGIRVSYGGLATDVPAINPPAVNARVIVTGIISTCLVPANNGAIQPNLRARSQGDIIAQ